MKITRWSPNLGHLFFLPHLVRRHGVADIGLQLRIPGEPFHPDPGGQRLAFRVQVALSPTAVSRPSARAGGRFGTTDGVINDDGVQVSSLRFNGPGTIGPWNRCDAPWSDSGLAWIGRAGRGIGSSPRGPTGLRAARLPLSVHEDQPLWIRVLVPPPDAGCHYNSLSIIDKVDDSSRADAYPIRGLLGFELDCSVGAGILG